MTSLPKPAAWISHHGGPNGGEELSYSKDERASEHTALYTERQVLELMELVRNRHQQNVIKLRKLLKRKANKAIMRNTDEGDLASRVYLSAAKLVKNLED